MNVRTRNVRLRTWLILALLFLAAWLPRVVALDALVTIDERKWLARSANFYDAVSDGDWANTFQREHPGVTVMWAGTLGFLQKFPDYPAQSPGQFAWEWEEIEAWLKENTALTPLELLAAGRWWVVLGVAMAVAASFLPLRRLFDEKTAVAATLFLAWSPFYVALSRQLHPDGLVASLAFLALLLFLAWLYTQTPDGRRPRRYLIASGIIMGLAWLTKTPAIFLVPTGLVLMAMEWLRPRTSDARRPSPLAYIAWGAIATATFVLLWPAMWVDPLGTLWRMTAEMSDYVERHTNINYFLGRPTEDPGVFFYPIAYLWRITPLTLAGLVSAGVLAWKRAIPFNNWTGRRVGMALVVYALLFTAFMTIGAKKFDRYMLPALLALDVLAALGIVGVTTWLATTRWSSRAANALLGGAILVHGLLGFVHYPYYLTYYNPLVGGTWSAPRVLFAGWGEGLDQAGAWLNAQPDIDTQRTVAWYHDGPLSYFYDGQAEAISSTSPMLWLDSDYAVVYINQVQRQIPSPEGIAWFDARTPVHTVRFRGLELARIYDMRDTTLPDFIEIGKEATADFNAGEQGSAIRLLAYELSDAVVAPGDSVQATFYLQAKAPMETNYNVLVRLLAPDGREVWRDEGWPWGAPTRAWPVREVRPDGHTITVPADLPPDVYQIELSFYDPATLDTLPVTQIADGAPISAGARVVAMLQVGDAPDMPPPANGPVNFDRFLSLTGASLPDTLQAGDVLPVELRWESLAPTATDYTLFVHVVDAAGNQVAGQDQPPRGGFAPTYAWRPGQVLADRVDVALPADLPPGEYEVRLGLYTLEGGRLPVVQAGDVVGDFVTVGRFLIGDR